jgi:hypothetical protein
VTVATHYFRRTDSPSRRWFRLTSPARYGLWQGNGQSTVLNTMELDDLLYGRRFPADFWAAVHSANAAFEEGDRLSWIESFTERRVSDPGQSVE